MKAPKRTNQSKKQWKPKPHPKTGTGPQPNRQVEDAERQSRSFSKGTRPKPFRHDAEIESRPERPSGRSRNQPIRQRDETERKPGTFSKRTRPEPSYHTEDMDSGFERSSNRTRKNSTRRTDASPIRQRDESERKPGTFSKGARPKPAHLSTEIESRPERSTGRQRKKPTRQLMGTDSNPNRRRDESGRNPKTFSKGARPKPAHLSIEVESRPERPSTMSRTGSRPSRQMEDAERKPKTFTKRSSPKPFRHDAEMESKPMRDKEGSRSNFSRPEKSQPYSPFDQDDEYAPKPSLKPERSTYPSQLKWNKKPAKPKMVKNEKEEDGSVRLNRLIARHGLCSRRKADEWIEEGRVSIDGVRCTQVGISVIPHEHTITIDGNVLGKPPALVYIAVHKPKGVVSTKYDPQGRMTVIDLIPKDISKAGVYPVGRLDRDSEGLLLLTNDGDWCKKLLHPRHQVWKRYYVETETVLMLEQIKRLEKGMMLDDKRTLPCRVLPKRKHGKMSNEFIIEIREGRNRQIRRICKKVGLHVTALKRIAVGTILLNQLKPGEYRRLTKEEVTGIFDVPEKSTAPKLTVVKK